VTRILAIALDAAEPSLIERWMEDGSLPNLSALRKRGAYGRLASPAEWMTGSSWPTFYTGQNPANHGFYNYLAWDSDKMSTETPTPERMPDVRPFWRALKDPAGPSVISIDIPLTFGMEPFNGKEVISLASHDSLVRMSGYPHEFVQDVRSRLGEQLIPIERYALQTKHEFLDTFAESIRVARQVGDLCLELIQKESWDLFLVSFATIHRAGHRLWGLHNITDRLTDSERIELSDALRQVYIKCDQIVGRLLEAAGSDATVLIFSVHGMGDNSSKTLILPEMLQRVLVDIFPDAPRPARGLLRRLRDKIPVGIRHRLKSSLTVESRHRLTAFWRTTEIDWPATRAFAMLSDMQGWIRINLKGRELYGIVEAGDFDPLCEQIAEGLRTFVDEGTNEPIVRNIVRPGQVFEGEKLDWLPDLIIQWNDSPVASLQAVVSPRYGRIAWPTPGQNPEGRSGNHMPQGMLIAAGANIKSGNITGAHILDLAPTILSLLGQPVPPAMEGKPLFRS
jgi:predicted AlkP superfamily phosphohydrolase/phosphomutase